MEEKNQPRRPRRSPEENTQKNESLVYGKNPVTELLKSGSGVDTVLIAEGLAPAVAAYYTALAKEAGATVKRVHPNKLRLMTGTESHQGVAAFASEIEYVTVDDLMAAAKAKVASYDTIATVFDKFRLRACSTIGTRKQRSGLAFRRSSGRPFVSFPNTSISSYWNWISA